MVNWLNDSGPLSLAAALIQVHALYDGLDAEIDFHKPRCVASGRCCNFEEYGHRLYATRLELEYFRHAELAAPADGPAADANAADGTGALFPLPLYAEDGQVVPGCPWQVAGLCTARRGRPLGCRIYFCDPTSTPWQNNAYERYHRLLKILHDRAGLPYAYMEWRAGLATLLEGPAQENK